MTNKRPERRRWFQFRLRTLLIVVLVLSLPLSWFAVEMDRARRQREAVVAIERLGGTVVYDWATVPSGRAVTQPASTWLRTLLGNDFFDRVVQVEFWDPRVTDADLKHLRGLTNLQSLCFGGSVTDAGLEHLRVLANLERLRLSDTSVTKEGVKDLQKTLPNCVIDYFMD